MFDKKIKIYSIKPLLLFELLVSKSPFSIDFLGNLNSPLKDMLFNFTEFVWNVFEIVSNIITISSCASFSNIYYIFKKFFNQNLLILKIQIMV